VAGGVVDAAAVTETAEVVAATFLGLTPVGWAILAGVVVVVAVAAVGTDYVVHGDHKVQPPPGNEPGQLPPAQNPTPAVDPSSGQPQSAPGAPNPAPVTDPSAPGSVQLPGQPGAASAEAARQGPVDLLPFGPIPAGPATIASRLPGTSGLPSRLDR
jgi:hypothetical protein